ncbi:lysophospholipid acyltransferase family protein [Croceiramulus getboli]|nr:lysophospholipid acyltransferase family protein [Flavobacteriaceae bacterium YJPT1-3]
MKWIRSMGVALWRVWFYILIALPILLLLPVLLISILKESWYPFFFRLARFWARFILFGMGFMPKVKRIAKPQLRASYMYIANHTSMIDIMMMLHVTRNPFVFVGKKELARFPLFGFFYKRTCILVDRGDAQSRAKVFQQAQDRLNQGLSICIFPEGGVPDDLEVVLDQFKDGAFRLAIDHQIPIVPIVFYDNKKRFPYRFFQGGPGRLRAKILELIPTAGMKTEQRKALRELSRKRILTALTGEF